MRRWTFVLGLIPVVTLTLTGGGVGAADEKPATPTEEALAAEAGATEEGLTPKKVIRSDQEWAKLLTRDQFFVMRRKGTEPAFSGKLLRNHASGTYACLGCGTPLFDSRTKFQSGTGWPSFYAPIDPERLATEMDYRKAGEIRTEVNCRTCDAHLGHVFNDGPPPTGLRFCLNSVALKFQPRAATKAKAKAKSPSKPAAPVVDTPARTP